MTDKCSKWNVIFSGFVSLKEKKDIQRNKSFITLLHEELSWDKKLLGNLRGTRVLSEFHLLTQQRQKRFMYRKAEHYLQYKVTKIQ